MTLIADPMHPRSVLSWGGRYSCRWYCHMYLLSLQINTNCPPVSVIIDPVPADHGGGAGGGPGQQGEGGRTQHQHRDPVYTGDCCDVFCARCREGAFRAPRGNNLMLNTQHFQVIRIIFKVYLLLFVIVIVTTKCDKVVVRWDYILCFSHVELS